MSHDRSLVGLSLLRICLGVFFFFQAMDKLGWILHPEILEKRLAGWHSEAGPTSRWYLETVAIPRAALFARLVMLGELATAISLLSGVLTRVGAGLAFLMVLNFHIARGAVFDYEILTSGYGLPVLGGLLALAIGGKRLPWSFKLKK